MTRIILALTFIALAHPAYSWERQGPVCGETPKVRAMLEGEYAEEKIEGRDILLPSGGIWNYQLWLNSVSQTWSLISVGPEYTCLLKWGAPYDGRTLQDFINPEDWERAEGEAL